MKDVAKFVGKERYTIEDLLEIITILRSPEGCPWDREQDHKSIRRDFLEECYEAIEAIDTDNTELLREELGDVLLQVVFHSEIEREAGRFDFSDVVSGVAEKMVVRHPHVFADTEADTTAQVLSNWDKIKRETKRQKTNREVLESVSPAMPALMRAQKVRKKAAGMGAQAKDAETLQREICETVCAATAENGSEKLGKALFDMTELARKLGVDAERALFETCRSYIAQFEADPSEKQ
ncbi:MAG: nucleoside triphosphate pyrophosphohydrolase [Hominenteromicrobium sp.]